MNSLLLQILISNAMAAPAAAPVVQKVDLANDLKNSGYVNLYDLPTGAKAPKLSQLAQLKNHEIHSRWNECLTLAPKVFASEKKVKGWVANVWLHCLSNAQDKKNNSGAQEQVLSAIAKSWDLFDGGPWSQDLWQNWVSQELEYLTGEVKKKNHKAELRIERVLENSARLSREQKSLCYQLLGDLAILRNDYQEAQFLFEESQSYKDSKYISERLDFLAKTRGQVVVKNTTAAMVEPVGEDGKLEERMRQSLKLNDLIPALKDSVALLNQFPGSRAARRLKDKPLEIYNSITDKVVADKALNDMQDADATRLLDWAQNLHRRGDWAASLVLADKAYSKNPQSQSVTSSLWVAGRSAHFLGQYDKAIEYYNKLISNANGSDEGAEALYRSALIYFRKQDFTTAAALFERLLQQGRDRYDLNAQYWLVRSLELSNNERTQKAKDALIEKYPFSYYGLRLKAEQAGNKLAWPKSTDKAPALESVVYLAGSQKKSWERFKVLSQAGWSGEAQQESADFPFIKDPSLKITLAGKLAERGQFFAAIRMINDAMENAPQLRRQEFLKIGYPEVFSTFYKKEGERYGLDPVLLRSLTRQESGFNMTAVSSSNALGLMQMIPPTAQETAKKLGMKVNLPDDMFRPEVNIPMGSYYVSQMLGQFENNVPFALAAYNAGPYRLKKWIEARPEISSVLTQPSSAPGDELWVDELPWNETSFYVKAILRNVLLYRMMDQENYTLAPVLWQDLLIKKAK